MDKHKILAAFAFRYQKEIWKVWDVQENGCKSRKQKTIYLLAKSQNKAFQLRERGSFNSSHLSQLHLQKHNKGQLKIQP